MSDPPERYDTLRSFSPLSMLRELSDLHESLCAGNSDYTLVLLHDDMHEFVGFMYTLKLVWSAVTAKVTLLCGNRLSDDQADRVIKDIKGDLLFSVQRGLGNLRCPAMLNGLPSQPAYMSSAASSTVARTLNGMRSQVNGLVNWFVSFCDENRPVSLAGHSEWVPVSLECDRVDKELSLVRAMPLSVDACYA